MTRPFTLHPEATARPGGCGRCGRKHDVIDLGFDRFEHQLTSYICTACLATLADTLGLRPVTEIADREADLERKLDEWRRENGALVDLVRRLQDERHTTTERVLFYVRDALLADRELPAVPAADPGPDAGANAASLAAQHERGLLGPAAGPRRYGVHDLEDLERAREDDAGRDDAAVDEGRADARQRDPLAEFVI